MRAATLSLLCLLAVAPRPALAGDDTFDQRVQRRVAQARAAVVGVSVSGMRGSRFGSGVLVRADGLVLTSTEVVPDAGLTVRVWMPGGQIVKAGWLASDPKTHTVVLKTIGTKGQAFPCVELADSSKAWVGQRAFTFGNPFEIIQRDGQVSTSMGVVAGTGELTDNGATEVGYEGPMIETDAAVNPGSSGGPLIDGNGRLLGLLTMAFQHESRLGVAVPIHVIRAVVKVLQDLPLKPTQRRQDGEPTDATMARVAATLAPAVVWIDVDRKPESSWRAPTFADDPYTANTIQMRSLMARPPGHCTGLAIDGGALVLTSAFHVTHADERKPGDGLKRIRVRAAGQADWTVAELVARDDRNDLALLRPKTPLPTGATVGDGSALTWGSRLAVIGRRRGSTGYTLTTGILSTPGRRINQVSVNQLDALCNYGNLGGPVVDLAGRVVGLTTFIDPSSRRGLNSGVAMFTRGEVIVKALVGLRKGAAVKPKPRPYLGCGKWGWSGIDPGFGARIGSVVKGTAAHKGGLRPGDTIRSLDGVPIGEWADLIRALGDKTVGQKVVFEVERAGKPHRLTVTLGRRR